jgi:uncharacterized protein (TIGR02266 family)
MLAPPGRPEEKRRYERVNTQLILVRVPAIDRLRGQYLKDLSSGGLFIKTEAPVPIGSKVAIELLAPGSDSVLELRGTVVRVLADEAAKKAGTAGVGVQLEDLTSEVSQRLAELLDENQAQVQREPEMDRLVTLLQSTLFDQAVLRDLLNEKDRQLADVNRTLASTSAGGAELMALKQQIADLAAELAQARDRAAGYQRELAEREEDEATSRSMVERLVLERTALERRLAEDAERGRLERERISKELALAAERERALSVQAESKTHLESALEELEGIRERAEFTAQAAVKQVDELREHFRTQLEASENRASALEAAVGVEQAAREALAVERVRLEEALKLERAGRTEAEAMARANDRLAQEWEGTLAIEKAARAEAERGLDAFIDQQRGAAAQLEAARARSARLEADLAEQVAQTEKARAREREVRRLLTLMGPKTTCATPESDAVTSPGLASVPPAEPGALRSAAQGATTPTSSAAASRSGPTQDGPASSAAASRSGPTQDGPASSAGTSRGGPTQDGLASTAAASRSSSSADVPANSGAAARSSAAQATGAPVASPPASTVFPGGIVPPPLPRRDKDAAGSSSVVISADLVAEAAAQASRAAASHGAAPELLEFAQFFLRLRSGGRVARGSAYTPDASTDPVELAVLGLLDASDSVDGLAKASKGRYSRERVAQVLFALYRRLVVELR